MSVRGTELAAGRAECITQDWKRMSLGWSGVRSLIPDLWVFKELVRQWAAGVHQAVDYASFSGKRGMEPVCTETLGYRCYLKLWV